MKRRKFLSKTALASMVPLTMNTVTGPTDKDPKELYELRTYELVWDSRMLTLEAYFRDALIPALNRIGVNNIGVFREYGLSDPRKVYVLLPFNSFEQYGQHFDFLNNDEAYLAASESFQKTPESSKIFFQYEVELMMAFEKIPSIIVPKKEERIFELRVYHGYNDDAVRRKILMFNKEEIDLFYKKGLNPVFFGKMLAGKNLPKLTYMLTFKNLEERDEAWNRFLVNNPEWDKMANAPEYANTVSKIEKTFLLPMDVSQV